MDMICSMYMYRMPYVTHKISNPKSPTIHGSKFQRVSAYSVHSKRVAYDLFYGRWRRASLLPSHL